MTLVVVQANACLLNTAAVTKASEDQTVQRQFVSQTANAEFASLQTCASATTVHQDQLAMYDSLC